MGDGRTTVGPDIVAVLRASRFRVLFMDDDEVRHRRIQEIAAQFLDVDLVRTWSVDEFEEAIRGSLSRSRRFDAVLLDHDLYTPLGYVERTSKYGGKHWVREHEAHRRQGMEAVEVMEELARAGAKYRPTYAIVHSWNTGKAPVMTRRLNHAGYRAAYVPFPTYPQGAFRLDAE